MVRFGDLKGLLIMAGSLLVFSIYIWTFITLHAKCSIPRKQKVQDQLFHSIYAGTVNNSVSVDRIKDSIIAKGMMMHMRDSEVWGHTHRMYLIGDGSISHPW